MNEEMPSQEDIRRRIRKKEWNTCQKKKQPIPPQSHETQTKQRGPKNINQIQNIGAIKDSNIEKHSTCTTSKMSLNLTNVL